MVSIMLGLSAMLEHGILVRGAPNAINFTFS